MSQFEERIQNILSEEMELPEVINEKAGQAFHEIQQERSKKSRRNGVMRYAKTAVIAMVVVLAVGTPVVAAVKHFGLLEYFKQKENEIPEEAVEMIVDDVKQDEMSNEEDTLVDFKIREYLYDAMQVYLVIEAKPIDEKYMLIPQWSVESDPVEDLNLDGVSGMSIEEYAKAQGKELLYANAHVALGGVSQSYDSKMEEDGTMVFIISGDNGAGTEQTEFVCDTQVYPVDMIDDADMIRDSFTFQMKATGSEKKLSYALADVTTATDLGIVVDEVVITETELAIHVEFLYHYIDEISEEQRKKNDDITFEILGADGEDLPFSMNSGGWTQPLDDGSFKEVRNYEKQDLPSELTIRLRDVFEKEVLGNITMVKE